MRTIGTGNLANSGCWSVSGKPAAFCSTRGIAGSMALQFTTVTPVRAMERIRRRRLGTRPLPTLTGSPCFASENRVHVSRWCQTRVWRRMLRRRSQKDWTDWKRIYRFASDYLPTPRVLHPWPNIRFAVRPRGGSPVRESRPPGSVRGGHPVTGVPTAITPHVVTGYVGSC